MANWLFYVMEWFEQCGGWEKAVRKGLAVQHYPHPGWTGAYQNLPLLQQIKKDDWLVAGRAVRFAGYAHCKSDFYSGGRFLAVNPCDGLDPLEFRERVDVQWYLVPGFEDKRNWLDLHDLKDDLMQEAAARGESAKWSEIDFRPGRCVWPISKAVFERVRRRLDAAGAKRYRNPR